MCIDVFSTPHGNGPHMSASNENHTKDLHRVLSGAASAAARVLRGASLVALLNLAGCGGGGAGAPAPSTPPVVGAPAPSPPPPPPEALFVPANAWTDAVPDGAYTVSPDEFRRGVVAGELQLVTPAQRASQLAAHRQHVADERAFLESKTDLSDDIHALLAEAAASTELDREPATSLPDGSGFSRLSLATRIESAAANYRLARDPANARGGYALGYSLLPGEVQAQLPAPASLQEASLERVREVIAQMDSALGSVVDLDRTRIDPDVPPAALAAKTGRAHALASAIGIDNAGVCTPQGYARIFWFPLRGFISPIKHQGTRGVCWAFAAIGALESRERVQNDSPVDLSEQFLVNKYKLEWYPAEYYDSGFASDALNAAVALNQPFMTEAAWTYNRALGRVGTNGVELTPLAYKGVCFDREGRRYEPCSENAHESRQSCTLVLGLEYCAYEKTIFTGPGVKASTERLIWSNGEPFNLQWYRQLLASGVSLLASFPDYNGFNKAPGGVVSDYARQMLDDQNKMVDGSYGGHEVQIVGFLSNEQLSFPGAAPVAAGGGGYFIIRNSWGCNGDGGFWYVPADYVSSIFSTLEVLDFDARRSPRWSNEQTAPGASSGLTVVPKRSLDKQLRVAFDLAKEFSVSHPLANYVRLTVSSNRDGVLYDGQWLINAPGGGSLFNNTLMVNFQSQGLRTLTITARYGTQVVTSTMDVQVNNSPPLMALYGNSTPEQGENYVINADVTDVNETNTAGICAAMTWSVDAPDTIVSGSGCMRVIRFGATGTREVRIASVDHEGAAGSSTAFMNVLPPPANPYPRITAFGLYSRDEQQIGGQVTECQNNAVADGSVIDLRQLGCKAKGINVPDRARFFLELGIENPAAESLSYDWTYTDYFPDMGLQPREVRVHTTAPVIDTDSFRFSNAGGVGVSTHACRIDVRVNASVAARNKSIRVWSGRCTNFDVAIR